MKKMIMIMIKLIGVESQYQENQRRHPRKDENSLSHTRWKCQYHIVFIPKYRRKVQYGKEKADIREILRTLCRYKKVEIIEGAVCAAHVHLCLSIPPKIMISQYVGYLKGKSALMVYDRHLELGNKFERDFWARGYYVSTIGNVDEETIRKYIREQEEESKKESRTLKKPPCEPASIVLSTPPLGGASNLPLSGESPNHQLNWWS